MANTKTAIATLIDSGRLPDVRSIGGRLKGFVFDVIYAAQAAADTIELGDLPAGFKPLYGFINTDTSPATATIALGIVGTVGKYRAAAVLSPLLNVPNVFGVFAAQLTAKDRVILTVGTAALPASGNLQILLVGLMGD